MDSAAAHKCNGCGFESLSVGYLGKGSAHWRETQNGGVHARVNVQCGGVHTVGTIFI